MGDAPQAPRAVPHVVIIGGGFGGLAAAKALARHAVRITLIDRRNHHLFQPLLYQVATAALSPAQIAAPIRRILSHYQNVEVLLAEATGIDTASREVILEDGRVHYDYLILAPGATHSYFGHDAWAPLAPGLKSIEDALTIRTRFLLAFEHAEREQDAASRRAELTFVIVGGGPTGVELAGAMVEIARDTIPKDFRAIDTTTTRVILVEAEPRVLAAFPPDLSERARGDLERLGVEVRLNSRVTEIDDHGVIVTRKDDPQAPPEQIATRNVIWAAGVAASPLGATLGVPTDRSGRVIVNPDLTIPGRPEVFVVGDLAHCDDPLTKAPVPGLAPAAIQMALYAADSITARIAHSAVSRAPFRYHDKGILATIGRAKAVVAFDKLHFGGFFAWLLWALVHVMLLISFRAKIIVMIEWAWSYLFHERGARLITNDAGIAPAPPPHADAALTPPPRSPSSTAPSAR